MSISSTAVNIVGQAQTEIENALSGLGVESAANQILDATVHINNQSNLTSAAIASSQKETEANQQAAGTLRG